MKDSLSYQVQQLLKENNLIVDFEELAFQIQSHPTYPSLHAVTGVLDHFNIENLALDVPINADTLHQLPNTFLAQVKTNDSKQFAAVTKVKNQYRLIFNSEKKEIISQSKFLEQFTGILLAVDKDESNIETSTSNITSKLIKGFTVTSIIVFILLLINAHTEIANYLFLAVAILGVYISTTILRQEQGETTMLGNAFCSNPTEKKSCNAILSSKAATLIADFKLSDLSLIYFSGLTLATSILIISNTSISIPKTISIVALPITLFSIYYQSIVVKKWCFLCLSIVGLMWLQAALSIIKFSPIYELTALYINILSFASISAFWFMASKLYKENKVMKRTKIEFFKFKRNFELFNNQLNQSKIINTLINDTKEISYGNANSNFHIVMISNPMCGHCKVVHKLAQDILKRYSDSVKLTIRFNINTKDPISSTVKITTRLLELHYKNGHETSLKAMDDIYGEHTTEQWLKKWDECAQSKKYLQILQKQYAWCTNNSINFTPEILINGQSYPKVYDRSDLIHFIEDLKEHIEMKSPQIPAINVQSV